MSDDWLWDKSGPPDPEVERLEKVLGELGYRPAAGPRASLPEARFARSLPARRAPRLALIGFALAATVALAVGAGWSAQRALAPIATTPTAQPPASAPIAAPEPSPPTLPAFEVTSLAGTPRVGDAVLGAAGRLPQGTWLSTDAASRARITVADIGRVEVGEDSRVRLVETGPNRHRLDLERGTLRARVDAPPRLFVVDTQAAQAVDLGCAYVLSVDPKTGDSTLHVDAGSVALEAPGRSVTVPRGASCRAKKDVGPGTPFYDDASVELRTALDRIDFGDGGTTELAVVLREARVRDVLTLYHLLARVAPGDRVRVHRRLSALVPAARRPPEKDVAELHPSAVDAWRSVVEKKW